MNCDFKMNIQLRLVFVTIVCLNLLQFVKNATTFSSEALIECASVHHIEIQNFANASYSNSKCALVCAIGNDSLPVESLNQGKSCPDDSFGICHNGQCIGGQEDAMQMCAVEHSLDFLKLNHQGTAFTNDQCTLRCVISGKDLSVNFMHEGSRCPANSNGVCRSGTCETHSTNPGSTVTSTTITTIQTTTLTTDPTTTVTKSSLDSFSEGKIKFLNISLESTVPSLNQHQFISLYLHETASSIHQICLFFGDPTKPNVYYHQHLNDMPNKLNKASQLSIDLFEYKQPHDFRETQEFVDLYSLLASFYQNHKLNFGEQENFVSKFAIHRIEAPHQKLMDVGLRFTIVFTRD